MRAQNVLKGEEVGGRFVGVFLVTAPRYIPENVTLNSAKVTDNVFPCFQDSIDNWSLEISVTFPELAVTRPSESGSHPSRESTPLDMSGI
jgi:hypothetical protein